MFSIQTPLTGTDPQPVSNSEVGKNELKSALPSVSGHPKTEKGKSPEENQVSKTSSSCSTSTLGGVRLTSKISTKHQKRPMKPAKLPCLRRAKATKQSNLPIFIHFQHLWTPDFWLAWPSVPSPSRLWQLLLLQSCQCTTSPPSARVWSPCTLESGDPTKADVRCTTPGCSPTSCTKFDGEIPEGSSDLRFARPLPRMWSVLEQDLSYCNWVCLKMGYTPNYSHLIGIMIINHWM